MLKYHTKKKNEKMPENKDCPVSNELCDARMKNVVEKIDHFRHEWLIGLTVSTTLITLFLGIITLILSLRH